MIAEDLLALVRRGLERVLTRRFGRGEARYWRDRARFGVAEADLARRQFRWAEAAEGYRRYLASRPRDAAITVRLAQTLSASGRIGEARFVLEAARERLPRSGALARAMSELRSVEESVAAGLQKDSGVLEAPRTAVAPTAAILRMEAGVTLVPEARAWLDYALATTGALAVYADHVICSPEGERGVVEVVHGAPHADDLATMPHPPVMALFATQAAPEDTADIRRALIEAMELGPVAHVPLILAKASRTDTVVPLEGADARGPLSRLLAIVPTRDEGDVLQTMIDSLRATAQRPDLLDIVVVDNGSRDPKTMDLLAGWAESGSIEVLRIDEPFNWSDLNNRAAKGRVQDLLLFINNDMAMRTAGWDALLRTHLSRPSIGAVGARLLYPAGNVQHAGVALGVVDATGAPGGPLHEGLGAGPESSGPLDRWVRRRPAAAVTGAFLATRRDVFEAVGGFDAVHFPVSCNDIDFCLRVRQCGLTVLYAGDIELIHDESLTRGHDDSEARQARVKAEKSELVRIWGEDALRDPSRSPHWIAHGTLIFHSLHRPERAAVLDWIARTGDAWRARRRA